MLDYRSVNTTKKGHNFITNDRWWPSRAPFFYPLVSWRSRKTKVTNNQPLSKKGHVTPPSQKGHVAWITGNGSLSAKITTEKTPPTARQTRLSPPRLDPYDQTRALSPVECPWCDLNPSTRVHFPYFFCGPGFRLGNYTVHFPHLFVETWV